MVTADPPPAGVSVKDETETSNEMTLSAGASPKRTWVDVALPVTGGGVGFAARDELLPPQPTARTIIAVNIAAKINLVVVFNECLKVMVCIVSFISPQKGDQVMRTFELSQSTRRYSFVLLGSGYVTAITRVMEQH